VEAFGSPEPSADVEIISMLDMLFRKLGLSDIELNINSIGCPKCRGEYMKKFKEYISPKLGDLCNTCKIRFEKNPMRILDCKEERCKELIKDAPAAIDYLCDECREHFEGLKAGLENLGIAYNIDTRIVRGQDYYSKTVFEFVSRNVGTQGTICGGGRYDGLIETCGGKPTPGVGFGLGIERLLMEMESQGAAIPAPEGIDLYIATVGNRAKSFAEKLAYQMRDNGVSADIDHMGRSLKSQMKYADKIGAGYSIVLGDDEIESNKAVLKNMKTGEQKNVSLDSILVRFKK
jgi:histidyl-tRNA synthetase